MFGPNSQSEEICFTTNSKAGISGFRDLHPANDPQEKMRKIQQDACRLLTKSQVSVRELAQFVGKATATIRALPTAPLHYRAQQFLMNSVHPTEDNLQEGVTTTKFNTVVQLNLTSKSDLQWWISLDRKSLSTPITLPAPSVTIESDASNKGWGAVLNGQTRTGGIWSVQEQDHHINYLELLAAFLALQAFRKTWSDIVVLCRLDNVTAVTYINQKGGTASKLLCQLAITIWNWCMARNISHSRTLAGSPQYNSGRGVTHSPGSLRLNAQPACISENPGNNGPSGSGPVCLSPDQTTSSLLQLESRPGSHGDRCIHAGLVSTTRVCQSSMVLDSPLSLQGENAISTSSVNHSLLEDPILVSNPAGTPGGLSSDPTDSARSGGDANTTGVPDETGSTPTDHLTYLRQSYSSQGFSSQASSLMLASWRDKTNSNYGSSFAKWASWCHQWGRNPFLGPISDVVNFLADFSAQGYQYQSLDSYHSSISSVHEAVDGVSVGTHPAVTRLL